MSQHLNSQQQPAPPLVAAVAISLVLFSLANIVWHCLHGEPTSRQMVQRGFRFLLTALLAYYLWGGRSWACKVTIVLAIAGVAVSFFLLATLPPGFTPFVLVSSLCASAVFYGGIACVLVSSSTVKNYFAGTPNTAETQEASAWNAPSPQAGVDSNAES